MSDYESNDEKITVKSLARRSKVAQCMMLSKSIDEIALELKISPSTVKRDKQWVMKEAELWVNEQALGGFVLDCQKQIERIEECIQNLKNMRNDPTLEIWQKLHLERTIVDVSAKKLAILDMMPMYHKFTNFMKKHASTQPDK
ncbi:helix-turn-helix transcriptional regulator [Candidatus Nitrosotenuis cloacae]|uniref:helix-turn-helix transcriptional regulator n=1 Tax=Candidatus Nitrosotenuis cloacae TaxID=1603555 RepID=UPI00228247E2|nr:hypothetical protein [Candidatus Nitrosotenuis cloacae]